MPVGGLGAVSGALARCATDAGAEILTDVGVSGIRGGDDGAEVTFHDGQQSHTVGARFALADVAPWVLQILLGSPDDPDTKPHGAQLMVDLLVDRLPRLRSGADPTVAFAATLHLAAELSHLEKAYAEAQSGQVPAPLPGRLDCPSLADPSVLGPGDEGRHTLSFLAHHTPAALFDGADRADAKQRAVAAVLATVNEYLEEPIESCLARDADGQPCLQARVPQDVEAELAMPGGTPLPRRPRLAVGAQPGPPRHTRAAVGRPDRRRVGPGLRLRSAPRRRHLRHRRPQRRPRRPRLDRWLRRSRCDRLETTISTMSPGLTMRVLLDFRVRCPLVVLPSLESARH